MMKRACLLCAVLFLATPGLAMEAGVSTSKGQQETHDRTLQNRKTRQKQESEGKRHSESKGTGTDTQAQELLRDLAEAQRSQTMTLSMSLEAVFTPLLRKLEEDREPFRSCRIISNPKLPKDFGFSAQVAPGIIDSIKSQYLDAQTRGNGPVSEFCRDSEVRAYRDCLALYGATLAQATENLNKDLRQLQALEGEKVQGIGYDDFETLAQAALAGAVETGPRKSSINALLSRIRTDPASCRFQGTREEIACGASRISLSTSPALSYAGLRFFGPNSYAGISGSYQVNAGWSYRDAIEQMKSTTQYAKVAQETSQYAEELESKGRARVAVMARKKAFDVAKQARTSAGTARIMP